MAKSKIHKSFSEDTVAQTMKLYGEGKLKTPQGKVVTDKKQALAIALNAAGISNKSLQKAEILVKTKVLKAELDEMIAKELLASNALNMELIKYFSCNRNPKVEEIHKITDKHGVAKADVEQVVYKVLTGRMVHKDLAVKRGKAPITKEEALSTMKAIQGTITVDTDHTIPYLAGYSEDGKTVYIDNELPEEEEGYPLWLFVIAHEGFEKRMLDEYHLNYKVAHQMALIFEQSFVEAMGLDWNKENSLMQKYVKKADKEKITNVPKDLDLTPYQDEDDFKTIEEMKKAE